MMPDFFSWLGGMNKQLEKHVEWTQSSGEKFVTIQLCQADLDELLRFRSEIGHEFPNSRHEFIRSLPTIATKLEPIADELQCGKGLTLIRGLPRESFAAAQLDVLFQCLMSYFGKPWPQNRHGHLITDVIDQGQRTEDPQARGYRASGAERFTYHTDCGDLVALFCLQRAQSGGLSKVANAVAIHNEMVRAYPSLAAELYRPLPFDARGDVSSGVKDWYQIPVFAEFCDRLFVHYVGSYIRSSQRFHDAPRLTARTIEAMECLESLADDPRFYTTFEFQPGDIQLLNNYHMLHSRTVYVDAPEAGLVRHLRRMWLTSYDLLERPSHFSDHPVYPPP